MILATPGPVEVPFFVKEATLNGTIHHRTPEFKEIFTTSMNLFKELINMPEALFLASSGSGAMEAAVINLCHKKALTINAGKFGERWGKICDAYNIEKNELKYEWNTPAKVEDVLEAIEKDENIDTFFIQVSESAGGLRHPVEEIAKAIKEKNENIIVVADGITAVGVEKIDTTNIDCLITGSQKALMLDPGLAMMGLSNKAVERIGKGKGFYFNLANELKKQKTGTTAFTPATTLIIGLKAVLEKINSMGVENLYDLTEKRHFALKEAMMSIGLDIYPHSPAKSMVAVYNEKAEDIRKILKEKYQVNVAGGQDHLKGNLFRINNMGIIDLNKMLWIANSVEMALSELGIREYDGTASKVFSKAIL